MENATKALIISGGVLIAILLLTLFTYLFSKMSSGTSKIYDIMEQSEIAEFNQKFLNYKGRDKLTIQDVVTIINLAKDGTEGPNSRSNITVKLDGTNITNIDTLKLFSENAEKKYKCTDVNIDEKTLLVKEVIIITETEGI